MPRAPTDLRRTGLAMLIAARSSIVLLLILLNGFFAMAEIALVSARPARLKALGGGRAASAPRPRSSCAPTRRACSATVQIGITVIAVLSGHLWPGDLGRTPAIGSSPVIPGFIGRYAHAISMAVVVIGISYFSLILGELVPKRHRARRIPSAIAAAFAPLMRGMARARHADRVVSQRVDRSDPAPHCRCAASRGAGDRRGDRLHAARGGRGRPHPAGRDRDRRDGAAARRPPGQRGDDAAHPDRISRSRRSRRRRTGGRSAQRPHSRFPVVQGGTHSSSASCRSRICSPLRWPGCRSICARRCARRCFCRTR